MDRNSEEFIREIKEPIERIVHHPYNNPPQGDKVAPSIVRNGSRFFRKAFRKHREACANDSDPNTCKTRYKIRVKKEQIDKMMQDADINCKTKICYSMVSLRCKSIKKEILGLQKKVSNTPPPKRPESERREDEIFKGHHPAVK